MLLLWKHNFLYYFSLTEVCKLCYRIETYIRGTVMLSQSIHHHNAILGAALQGTAARQDAIMNNIANSDVPGFTARTVHFESALQKAIDNWQATGTLDLSRARPSIQFQEAHTNFRMDQNNVDMEREMVALYINSIRYDVLVNSVMHNSRMLNTVLQGR